jgi:hypothetical protein
MMSASTLEEIRKTIAERLDDSRPEGRLDGVVALR